MSDVSTSITDKQSVKANFAFLNSAKTAAEIVGLPTFAFDKQGVISLFPADDGSNAKIVALAAGSVNITMKVQAKSGATVSVNISVTVTATGPDPALLEVTDIQVTFDAPVAQ
jgi:uncharacterized protein YjdB